MTTAFVLRLDKERAARLKSAARKRSTSRSAIVREALDRFLADEASPEVPRKKGTKRSGKVKQEDNDIPPSGWAAMADVPPTPPGEGVGWREHFKWLKKHGRRVNGRIADEIRELDRNRGFR